MLTARIRKQQRSAPAFTFLLDVSLEVPPGITILFGPSGAGKSTLLDCLAGLSRPDEGRIAVGDDLLFDSSRAINLPPQKRRIAYVFQALALFPHLTAEENVAYGLKALHEEEKHSRAQEILKVFRVEKLSKQKPGEISGGERQRIALARSLVTDPRLLLLDEPLTGLDAELKSAIVDDLRAWNAAKSIPILYVTHSREEVDALGVMRVRLGDSPCEIEVPLGYAVPGSRVQIAMRAGDILLATERPHGLSARNVLEGRILSLEPRGTMVIARVDCGVTFIVHVTPSAVRALELTPHQPVWLVLKTHSCHLVE